jgi:hypothetical protein
MTTIRIFRYLDDLDCFVVSDKYRRIADQLGLTEWSPVGWIGRLFTLCSRPYLVECWQQRARQRAAAGVARWRFSIGPHCCEYIRLVRCGASMWTAMGFYLIDSNAHYKAFYPKQCISASQGTQSGHCRSLWPAPVSPVHMDVR